MTFKPATTSKTVDVGGTGGDLDIPVALLANAPSIQIGGTDQSGAITISGDPGLSGKTLSLATSGSVSQTAAITAESLELLGGGAYTLTNTGNNIATLAGNTGNLNYVNSDALIIGTVNTSNGITSTGTLDITTVSGDIDINNDLSWSSSLFTLTAANDININATLTATGTAALTMTANNDTGMMETRSTT